MNQADWTPSPSGELDALMRRRRLAQHDSLALTVGALAIVLATIVWIGGAVAIFQDAWGVGIAVVTILVADFVVARRVDQRRDALIREVEAIDRGLRDEFGGGEGWFVDLLILRGAAPIGADRGMMWIEGDRLYFSGHRTSFALTPDGAEGRVGSAQPIRGLRHRIVLPLTLADVSVSVQPPSADATNLLARSLRDWTRLPTQGGGQFPPTAVGPGRASRAKTFVSAVVSSAYWMGAVALAARVGEPSLALIVLGASAAMASVLHLWFPLARWRAWADLGRVGPPSGLPSPRGFGE